MQAAFNSGRQESLILFPQVVYRYLKILITVNPKTLAYYSYLQEFFLTILTGMLLAWMTLKKAWRPRFSYLLFCWGAYLLPPLTGTFTSMPRYVLVLFPIYFFFAQLWGKFKKLGIAWLIISALLLMFNVLLFIQGRWVA